MFAQKIKFNKPLGLGVGSISKNKVTSLASFIGLGNDS